MRKANQSNRTFTIVVASWAAANSAVRGWFLQPDLYEMPAGLRIGYIEVETDELAVSIPNGGVQ